MEHKDIHIKLWTNRKSDLLMAVSDDLPGLMVHGRTAAEINERVPEAIRSILEAQGHVVVSLTSNEDTDSHWIKPEEPVLYSAELARAA